MSNNPGQAQFEVCVSDTGGTFTDTFIVGSNDDFVAAKQYEAVEGIWLLI